MKKSILATLLAAASLAPLAAFASDGTITFTGSTAAPTCTISINGGSASPTVTLPTVSSSTLAAAGNVAGATNFSVSLTGCTLATGARVSFEPGAGVDAPSGRLLNTGTAGPNVQVQLLNAAGGVIVAGAATGAAQNNGAYVAIVGNAATMNYTARYYATGAAGNGTVASSVTYSIDYQ